MRIPGIILLIVTVLSCTILFSCSNPASPIPYEAGSYNAAASKRIEAAFLNDSLSAEVSVKAMLYDKIKDRNLAYIDISYTLKKEYHTDGGIPRQLRRAVDRMLYSLYPETGFTGMATWHFMRGNRQHETVNQIGTLIQP